MAQATSDVIAYCTSCKMDLNHVVVAMKGDQIAKVQCYTCRKEHKYYAPKGVLTPGDAPTTTAAKKSKKSSESAETVKASSIENEWIKLMTAHKNTPAKAYSTKAGFILGDKINHTTFGEGIVSKQIFPNKIEVIFQTDLKTLIHAG